MGRYNAAKGENPDTMYASLLKLFVEVLQDPLMFIGVLTLLMASWGMIVLALYEIGIRLFDAPPADHR